MKWGLQITYWLNFEQDFFFHLILNYFIFCIRERAVTICNPISPISFIFSEFSKKGNGFFERFFIRLNLNMSWYVLNILLPGVFHINRPELGKLLNYKNQVFVLKSTEVNCEAGSFDWFQESQMQINLSYQQRPKEIGRSVRVSISVGIRSYHGVIPVLVTLFYILVN